MNTKKAFALVLVVFGLSASAFAFDSNTFWKNYGGGLKHGDGLLSIGSSFGIESILYLSTYPGSIYIPPIDISYERMVLVNQKLPFSFGGYINTSMSFLRPDVYNKSSFWLWPTIGALAKYHFDFGVKNLDVYAGVRLGLGYNLYIYGGEFSPVIIPVRFDAAAILGLSYFFTDNFALSVETGAPYLVTLRLAFKI